MQNNYEVSVDVKDYFCFKKESHVRTCALLSVGIASKSKREKNEENEKFAQVQKFGGGY